MMIQRKSEVIMTIWFSIAVPACLALCGCDLFGPLTPPGPEALALAEEKEPAARLAASAAADFEALVNAGGTTPVDDLIAALRNEPGVTSAELSVDGSTIVIQLDDGQRIALFTDEKNRSQWQTGGSPRLVVPDAPPPVAPERSPVVDSRKAQAAAADPDDFIVCDETSFPQASRACVVMNFPGQFGQNTDAIKTPLERAGFTVDVIRLSNISDVKNLQANLSGCGVIYISTHGGVGETRLGKQANLLATEIEIAQGDALAQQMQEMLGAYSGGEINQNLAVVGANGKAYWGLTPDFFASANYKNTMVFIDACQSDHPVGAGGQSLKDVFLDRGAGAFIGWSDSISTKFSNPAAAGVFDGLAPADIGVQSMSIFTDPSNPSASQAYVPTVQVTPPAAGIEVRMSIVGTDFFRRSETRLTDAFGEATFSSVPGGATGVTDTITAVTGGADNGATVVDVSVKNDPTLPDSCRLPWQNGEVSIANLKFSLRTGANANYNLVCNNPDVTTTDKVVKF